MVPVSGAVAVVDWQRTEADDRHWQRAEEWATWTAELDGAQMSVSLGTHGLWQGLVVMPDGREFKRESRTKTNCQRLCVIAVRTNGLG